MTAETPTPDPVFSRICETSARLMAGVVSRGTMKQLQKLCRADGAGYPWETVVDRVLAEPMAAEELTPKALKSQRDWVIRGGRETPGKGVRHHAKSFVARLTARLIFMAVFVPCVVVLLVLLKLKWPDLDIYAANGWLQDTLPGVFGPR